MYIGLGPTTFVLLKLSNLKICICIFFNQNAPLELVFHEFIITHILSFIIEFFTPLTKWQKSQPFNIIESMSHLLTHNNPD